jgi:hypothetical protein
MTSKTEDDIRAGQWKVRATLRRIGAVLDIPLTSLTTFFDRSCSNLQGMLIKVKTEFHFFNFFFNLLTKKFFEAVLNDRMGSFGINRRSFPTVWERSVSAAKNACT